MAGPFLLILLGCVFSQKKGWSGAGHEVTDFLGGLAYAGVYALVFSAIAILVASLASRRAVAAAAIVGAFLVTAPVAGVLGAIGGRSAQELAPVINPVTLVQGLKTYVFRFHEGLPVGDFGAMYVAIAVSLVILCATMLQVRYRKVNA